MVKRLNNIIKLKQQTKTNKMIITGINAKSPITMKKLITKINVILGFKNKGYQMQ